MHSFMEIKRFLNAYKRGREGGWLQQGFLSLLSKTYTTDFVLRRQQPS